MGKRIWHAVVRRTGGIFLWTVLIPTAVAALYYGLIASDVYISESHFIVRSQERQAPTGLGALLTSSGLSHAQDDTYAVVDFLTSRDALRALDRGMNVRKAFSDVSIDRLNRFPALDFDESFEGLYRFYQKHVEIAYDSSASIAVLRVRAYRAADAARANELLLAMSEELVNRLNDRSRHDTIDLAQAEVARAEARAKAAALALSNYRSEKRVFDPERQGLVNVESSAKLREQLVAAQAQLAQVRGVSPTNPQIAALEQGVALIKREIEAEDSRLLSRDGGLSAKSPQYDQLVLEQGFANRQLATAMTELDNARNEAVRQQLYLERLVQPGTPDKAEEPHRLRAVFTVLLVGLVSWGVLSLILASVREHAE
jgi:capsular polysaccharide transport system permease protein